MWQVVTERIEFPNGDVYEGEWKFGKQHGRGKITYSSGAVYEGEWKDGKRHGRGKITYPNGAVYEGEWKEDKPHGHGKYTHPDGRVYEGEFEDGERHGDGKYTRANSGVIKEGRFEQGKFVGAADAKVAIAATVTAVAAAAAAVTAATTASIAGNAAAEKAATEKSAAEKSAAEQAVAAAAAEKAAAEEAAAEKAATEQTVAAAAAEKAAAEEAAAEQPEPEDPVLEELTTTEGTVYASITETYTFMMSDGVPIARFHNTTGEIEQIKGEDWMPCNLDASGATTSGGVAGTSVGSGAYSNPEIKKRRKIFLKQCQTHGGFNLGERTNLMASGCHRTCLPDAMLTIESHLKGTQTLRDTDKAETRRSIALKLSPLTRTLALALAPRRVTWMHLGPPPLWGCWDIWGKRFPRPQSRPQPKHLTNHPLPSGGLESAILAIPMSVTPRRTAQRRVSTSPTARIRRPRIS